MYATGRGTKKDRKKGIELWMYLAEKGHALAQYNIGDEYYYGDGGISQNYKEAAKWYELSANQGHDPAKVNLGILYLEGNGVTLNITKAYTLWNEAAKQGNTAAQENLNNLCNKNPSICK